MPGWPVHKGKGEAPLPHSTKQRAIAFLLQRFNRLLRQCCTITLELLETSLEIHKGELQAQGGREGFEDAPSGRYDFSPDAVARYQAYT